MRMERSSIFKYKNFFVNFHEKESFPHKSVSNSNFKLLLLGLTFFIKKILKVLKNLCFGSFLHHCMRLKMLV